MHLDSFFHDLLHYGASGRLFVDMSATHAWRSNLVKVCNVSQKIYLGALRDIRKNSYQ